MKKSIIVGSIAALSLLGASAAHAEDANVSGSADARANIGAPIRAELRADARFHATSTREERQDGDSDVNDDRPSTTTRPEFKDKRVALKAEIETRKLELEQRRASSTAEIKIKRANEIAKMTQNRFNEELSRLSAIKGKIDTRLAKFDQAGASTTAARADLALAVNAMGIAQAKVSVIASLNIATSTPQAIAGTIRQAAQDAQKAINDAQKALMKVVSDMKGLEADIHATTTAETR